MANATLLKVLVSLDGNKVASCRKGEKFQMGRHASGTEVKAITYSAMQVNQDTAEGDVEVFVIVDI